MDFVILNTASKAYSNITLFQKSIDRDNVQSFIHELLREQLNSAEESEKAWLTDEHILGMVMDLINTCNMNCINTCNIKCITTCDIKYVNTCNMKYTITCKMQYTMTYKKNEMHNRT